MVSLPFHYSIVGYSQPRTASLFSTHDILPTDDAWYNLYAHFDPLPEARQIFDMAVDLAHTSCGLAYRSMVFLVSDHY